MPRTVQQLIWRLQGIGAHDSDNEDFRNIGEISDADLKNILAVLESNPVEGVLNLPSLLNLDSEEMVMPVVLKAVLQASPFIKYITLGAWDDQSGSWTFHIMHTECGVSCFHNPQTVDTHRIDRSMAIIAHAIQTDMYFTRFYFYFGNLPNAKQYIVQIGQALQKAPRPSGFTLDGISLGEVAADLDLTAECTTWTNKQILHELWRPWRQEMLFALAMVSDKVGLLHDAYDLIARMFLDAQL
jgi:hypothetical protein